MVEYALHLNSLMYRNGHRRRSRSSSFVSQFEGITPRISSHRSDREERSRSRSRSRSSERPMEEEQPESFFGRQIYLYRENTKQQQIQPLQKAKQNMDLSSPREIIPTIELPKVAAKLSYREYVLLREQDTVTMDEAEENYAKYILPNSPSSQLHPPRAIQERDQLLRRDGERGVVGGAGASLLPQAMAPAMPRRAPIRSAPHALRAPRRLLLPPLRADALVRRVLLRLSAPPRARRPLHLHPLHPSALHAPLPPRLAAPIRRTRRALLRRRLPLPPRGTRPPRLRPLRLPRADPRGVSLHDGQARAAERHRLFGAQRAQRGGGRRAAHLHHALLPLEARRETPPAPRNRQFPAENRDRPPELPSALGRRRAILGTKKPFFHHNRGWRRGCWGSWRRPRRTGRGFRRTSRWTRWWLCCGACSASITGPEPITTSSASCFTLPCFHVST